MHAYVAVARLVRAAPACGARSRRCRPACRATADTAARGGPRRLLMRGTRWFMTQGGRPLRMRRHRGPVPTAASRRSWTSLDEVIGPRAGRVEIEAARVEYEQAGDRARQLAPDDAGLPQLLAACDIVCVAPPATMRRRCCGRPASISRSTSALDLPWLQGPAVQAAPRRGRWERLALTGLEDDSGGRAAQAGCRRHARRASAGMTRRRRSRASRPGWMALGGRTEALPRLVSELHQAGEADLPCSRWRCARWRSLCRAVPMPSSGQHRLWEHAPTFRVCVAEPGSLWSAGDCRVIGKPSPYNRRGI